MNTTLFISSFHNSLPPRRRTAFVTPLSLTPVRPLRRHAHPAMLLGIPRIFGARSKQQKEQLVETVEAPPPPPPAKETPVQWARAHPFQAAAVISLLIALTRRAIGAVSPSSPAANKSRTKTASPSITSSTSSPPSVTTPRAVPRRHETREEALDLLGNTARKYIIVGGKGGVGKTSMSAAAATAFADRGQTTLIVSTDPAHSLSDAFGQSVSGGDPVPVMGIDNLYAQEVDPESMKATFKMMQELEGAGAGAGMQDMGLDDLNSLFETIPPGFDEAVALVEIVKYIQADAEYAKFDRIVFDTAPTGHTLRLLALPDFLNGFFGKLISMKSKFGTVMSQFKGMFGANEAAMDSSVEDMEELKRSMSMVRELFRDELQTEFIVATIPSMMAIAESKRLHNELQKEKIPVRHVFVNQLQPENEHCTFCAARFKEQKNNLKLLEREFEGLQIATVQSFDKEIKGAGALRAMSAQLFPQSAEQIEEMIRQSADKDKSRTSGSGGSVGEQDGGTRRAEAELVE
ncbi:putative arsenical pump-driving ATPase [Gracilariopsis chorda]|uniref:Putative arsenical pump-driving ATPase n=1 Tax=Gracilariopsis chorda TaxID=448386 RepID=A0A2V3IHG9_9FLOR|nr:putative arsenical pump-driving ATPase [Gracilariopsis chorda]|eukprot:PXF40580.1 putative arsenical pump-driving ATPase [Gracilariopsis chorda]